jgi:hypothetical protein
MPTLSDMVNAILNKSFIGAQNHIHTFVSQTPFFIDVISEAIGFTTQ